MLDELDIRVAHALHGVASRRTFISRSMRWMLGTGMVVRALTDTATADAANCSYYGHIGTWGNTCNPGTPTCLGGQCDGNGNAKAGYKRCDAWTHANSEGQYCWCSNNSYWGTQLGYFTCCDAYTTSGSLCNRSGTHCICPQWHCISGGC